MKRSTFTLIAGTALVLGAQMVFAESLWVKNESVDLRAGKGAAYDVVATVKKGQELQVVSRDGKWVQVQGGAGATPGWVFEAALSPQKVNADAFTLNQGAAGVNSAAAARGLEPSSEQYASAKGMSKGPLEHLIALRHGISAAEWEAFNREVQPGAR